MATVEEVKAGVIQFGDETIRQTRTIHAVADSLDQTAGMLRAVTASRTYIASF